MKNTKQILSALLAVIMLLSSLMVFTSCAENKENEKNPEKQTSVSTVTPGNSNEAASEGETEKYVAYDKIEKEKFDREFVILSRGDMKDEFEVEKITGEILSDLIYERNTVVSEDLDISIEVVDGGEYNEVNNELIRQVTSNDDDYDMFTGHKVAFMNCATGNYLYDLNEISTMNLDAPYWDQACRENLSIMGKNFMMTGDLDPASMLISACFVFNKELNKELGKTEPYELVDNKKWTLDNYLAQIQDVSQDLNNDGAYSAQDDRFSTTIWSLDGGFSMFYGAGGRFVSVNADGEPELTYSSERVIDIYEKLYKVVVSENAFWLPVTQIGDYGVNYSIFTEGRALYCDITLAKISSFLADMDADYGIVPVPKYDEAQDEYLSFVNGASPFAMVAQTEKTPDFVGTVLEAMSAYNYDNITPKMFEIVTKLQSARDPDSSRMVDYIIRNRVYDFGYFMDLELTNVVMQGLSNNSETIASDLKSKNRAAERALGKLVDKFSA
ncbi:MAG: hypothetical protein E7645_06435 [Ruminococcaceae bacterium]|nr:hypothetical protein [Oscillospiraceae bacterium]